MIFYKDFGFVNTKEMFAHAMENKYAVPAYNFSNMEQLQAIVEACGESKSPVILQISKGGRDYANSTMLSFMVIGAMKMAKEKGFANPIALHLDHGDSFELCKEAIENGFSSVMIDGSSLPYQENVELTSKVVEYAHKFDVSVEGELGILSGIEDDVSAAKDIYTKPEEVEDFVKKTGVDSLAISIGTSHGAFKFNKSNCTIDENGNLTAPNLRFDILEEIEKILPNFPIVLHGASSIPQDFVRLFNNYGGKLDEAIGVSEEQLRDASKSAVCKINIDSDSRIVFSGAVRKFLTENPSEFDPRKYLGVARNELKNFLVEKNTNVLGSANRY
jgi:fructose-bisphosphate aldolase, class II